MEYSVVLDPPALQDVQQAIDYYDSQRESLGEVFENTLDTHLETLKANPHFQRRYGEVHCLPMR